MEQKKLTELDDQELLEEQKKLKTNKIINATLIGLFVGVFVYGAVKNGFTFFTFFPLLFALLLVNSGRKKIEFENELKNEINARNIK